MNPLRTNKIASFLLMLTLALSSLYIPMPKAAAANQTVSCTDNGGVCTENQDDITTAFNATDTNGDSVFLNAGTYVLTNTLSIPANRILDCQNKATGIIKTSTANGIALAASAQLKNCTIDATAEIVPIHVTGANTTITSNNIKG
ncbi:hypothetical protein HOH51_01180, partial [bacterium]|nr:hypothetical protein [bacterium]